MNNNKIRPTLVILVFTLQAILNWGYVLWIRQQFEIIPNAWFTLTPLFSFFYIAFFLFAFFGLYYRTKLGIGLAYWIILFGVISDVLSYELAFNSHYLVDVTIIPMIVINLCVMLFMGLNQSYFKAE